MAEIKILYVEDEPNLGQIVSDSLIAKGFDTMWITQGAKVVSAYNDFDPDLCVLDIMLPDIDGYQLCEQIRSRDAVMPIIFLTAKVETPDLVKGFEAGATDYIRKPFSLEELMIRIQNQLRIHGRGLDNDLSQCQNSEPEKIVLGSYTFYPQQYELVSATKRFNLSHREGELLKHLTQKGSKVVERKEILIKVWGNDSYFNSRTLDVYIKKLRNYLSEDPTIQIQTLRGKGYLFLIRP